MAAITFNGWTHGIFTREDRSSAGLTKPHHRLYEVTRSWSSRRNRQVRWSIGMENRMPGINKATNCHAVHLD